MNQIHFIGGEKGGVGKSVLSRILTQYFIDEGLPLQAFDGDLSNKTLSRFYGDYAKAVDLASFEDADLMIEGAVEAGQDIIVDLPAQNARDLDKWFKDTELLTLAGELGLKIRLWHVMDDGTDSVRLLDKLLDTHGEEANYVIVRNHGRGKDFRTFDESETKQRALKVGAKIIDLPALHPAAMLKIDRFGSSLWAAINNRDAAQGDVLGLLERQRVKVWLAKAYAEIDSVL